MRWSVAILAVIGLSILGMPVAGHGNYVSTDHQVTDDGTVRIELVVTVTDAVAVLRTNDGGEPGAVIGHRVIGDGFVHPDLEIQIDESHWEPMSGNTTVWVVLHRNDGDESFDPDEDPALETPEGDIVATQFTVRRSQAGKVNIQVETDHAEETNTSTVTVRRVELATPGYLVVRANEHGTPGRVIGHTPLDAGVHRDITIAYNESYYRHQPEQFSLWIGVHRNDGDESFDPTDDSPILVDGKPIVSQVALKRTDPIEPTPPPTTPPDTNDDDHHHDHDDSNGHEHDDSSGHEETTAPTETRTEQPHVTTPEPGTTTAPGQPGFGLITGSVALFLALLIAARRIT